MWTTKVIAGATVAWAALGLVAAPVLVTALVRAGLPGPLAFGAPLVLAAAAAWRTDRRALAAGLVVGTIVWAVVIITALEGLDG